MPFTDEDLDRLLPGDLNTPDNRNTLTASAQYARGLGGGLSSLQQAGILNQDNFNTLTDNAQYAQELGWGLSSLQEDGILNQDNRNTLTANAQYARGLGWGLSSLQQAGILNQDNRNTLTDNAQYAEELGGGLFYLQQADILNQDNFNTLTANAQYAEGLGRGLYYLQQAGILNQDNRNTLTANAVNAVQAAQDIITGPPVPHELPPRPALEDLPEPPPGGGVNAAILRAAEKEGIDVGEIPGRFICGILSEIMDRPMMNAGLATLGPVGRPSSFRADYAPYLQAISIKPEDPGTRIRMMPEDLKEDEVLSEEIKQHVAPILIKLRIKIKDENAFSEFVMPKPKVPTVEEVREARLKKLGHGRSKD